MRLDASQYLHFISRQEMRILAAIEMGMRNHEYVSAELIAKIGNLKGGQTYKTIQKLLKNKFITHIGNKCNGYKLTFLGYDYLALQTFIKRGLIKDVLGKIGVGKESDIYKCVTPEGELCVLKLTRLGRNSFRSVKKNREYIQHRTNYNWLYLSRLSSIRQFLFMQLLHQNNFPTPKPIDTNRHAILMSLVDGDTLCHIQRITSQAEIRSIFEKTLEMLIRFAKNGLIHGDFNEFNLMVNADGTKLTVIDFPQCISVKHPNAGSYFNRDVQCVFTYFDKLAGKSYEGSEREEGDMKKEERFNVQDYAMPVLEEVEIQRRLDHEIKTVGHITLEEYNQLEQYRSEEERMKAEMDKGAKEEEEEEEGGEQKEGKGQEEYEAQQPEQQGEITLEKGEEEEINNYQKQNEEERNKLDNIQPIQAVQAIEKKREQIHKYDEQLQKLINDLGDNFAPQLTDTLPKQQEKEADESSEEEERFKGMTPYEIRIKIKQQKRVERQKRKQATSTEDYIKKALRKSGTGRVTAGKGNHGNKNRIKQTNLEIKQTFF